MFPESNNTQSIIDCLESEIARLKVTLKLGQTIEQSEQDGIGWKLNFKDQSNKKFDIVIIATGGSPKIKGFDWLKNLGHNIISPIPSLFTFNMPSESITSLSGISLKEVKIKILNTKIEISGPLLITHWGMSGPVILKASSFGARDLFEKKYIFELQVNWLFESNTEILFSTIEKYSLLHSKKLLSKQNPFKLPSRLWSFLITKFILSNDKKWGELGKKNMRKLIEFLTKDIYKVSGKTTFKEEFVTCGGISLESIDIKTMQSKTSKDLYFAGEVLNIDGITGGYNFQSAWSTGYIAGKLGN